MQANTARSTLSVVVFEPRSKIIVEAEYFQKMILLKEIMNKRLWMRSLEDSLSQKPGKRLREARGDEFENRRERQIGNVTMRETHS